MDRKKTTDRPGNINLCQLATDPGKPIIFCLRSLFSNLRVRHQEALRQLKLTTAIPTQFVLVGSHSSTTPSPDRIIGGFVIERLYQVN